MIHLSRQKKIYYCFNFVNRFMVYMPIFVLFLKMKGLNQTQIMAIMAAYNLSIMMGEIPTGAIADNLSRKTSVIIGCLIQGAAMFCMIPFQSFFALLCVEVFFGVGLTFQSGAMSAMFYDYLKSIDKEDLYPDIEGKRWACVFLSQAIASFLGGALAGYNLSLTILVTSFAYLLSGILLIGFKEVGIKRENQFKYTRHVYGTIKYMVTTRKVLALLVIIILTEALFSTTLWLYQPYYQMIGIKVSTYGLAYFLMNSVSALGGFLSGRMKFSLKTVVVIYIVGNSALVAVMGIVQIPIGMFIPSFIFFLNGLLNPWIRSFWESSIDGPQRATASSVLSLLTSLVFAVVAIPVGYISDHLNVYAALSFPAILYMAVVGFLFLCSRVIKKK